MSRSVVLKGGPRCKACCFPPRWCICDGAGPITTPLAIEVLQHSREVHKPTSTGSLVLRTVSGSRGHVFRRGDPAPDPKTWVAPDRELWTLHPNGDPLDAGPAPSHLQLVLLDASWAETRALERVCDGVGRRVALPMSGESRYWLRTQNGPGRFSTIEALLFTMRALGLAAEAQQLGERFERHVYAGLRSRGRIAEAKRYLQTSSFGEALSRLADSLGR